MSNEKWIQIFFILVGICMVQHARAASWGEQSRGRPSLQHFIGSYGRLERMSHLFCQERLFAVRGEKVYRISLHEACERGALQMVQRFIVTGSPLYSYSTDGLTPLGVAIWAGSEMCVIALLQAARAKGEKIVNMPNASGFMPLHVLAERPCGACLSLLLNYGADMYAENDFCQTPFEYALQRGNFLAMRLFIEKGFANRLDIKGCRPLNMLCAHGGFGSLVEYWVRCGVAVDRYDAELKNPLHHAVSCGDVRLVCFLVMYSSLDPDAVSIHGTPLHIAIRNQHMDMVKLLLSFGACYDTPDMCGMTPVRYAVWETLSETPEASERAKKIFDELIFWGVKLDSKTMDLLAYSRRDAYYKSLNRIYTGLVEVVFNESMALQKLFEVKVRAKLVPLLLTFLGTSGGNGQPLGWKCDDEESRRRRCHKRSNKSAHHRSKTVPFS